MATKKENTFSAMNSAFLNTASMKINEGYLNELLIIDLCNVRQLNDKMLNDSITPLNTVLSSLLWEADQRIESLCTPYPATKATSEQLKAWLEEYGHGYESIADAVSYVEQERAERKAEKE